MGLRDLMRSLVPATAPNGVPVEYRHFETSATVLGLTVEDLWRTQPYLRTVVTFLARNIAQLGLHSFERVSDTDRVRVRDDALPRLLSMPNARMTSYELVYSLVADLALYDEAYWWVTPDEDADSGWSIEPLRPSWIAARGGGSVFGPAWYDVHGPTSRKSVRVPADQMLIFRGWDPSEPAYGSSPVNALKQILAEQIEAQRYREQVWRRGGRVSSVLTRPAGGPRWDDTVRERFKADWKSRWTGDGADAGGTPILEDGMTLQKMGFSAHEDEYIAAAKLSLSMVASAYHVNPTMVGVLENANYSNVREFRRMLYGDTLGPTMAMIEDRINTFLVPRVASAAASLYVEFNINEKLQGSFEEQTTALQSAVGRPWMTADEARGITNMPSLGGVAAQLVTPLNVIVGGQASPTDSGSQNRSSGRPRAAKARAPDTHRAKHAEVLSAFFARQGRAVRTALGVKADADWWDVERWDRELAADMYRLAVMTSGTVAAGVLEGLGFDPDVYDADRTLAFLLALAERVSGEVNTTTKAQLDAALSADDEDAVAHVFDLAADSRADQLAATLTATVAGFATVEAAKQVGGDQVTKTWLTGANPRPSHAALNGETVGIEEPFSNGAQWPADGPTADEAAGCNCDVQINVP